MKKKENEDWRLNGYNGNCFYKNKKIYIESGDVILHRLFSNK